MNEAKNRVSFSDVCMVLGVLAMAAGLGVIYWPAAVILVGISLVIFGWVSS